MHDHDSLKVHARPQHPRRFNNTRRNNKVSFWLRHLCPTSIEHSHSGRSDLRSVESDWLICSTRQRLACQLHELHETGKYEIANVFRQTLISRIIADGYYAACYRMPAVCLQLWSTEMSRTSITLYLASSISASLLQWYTRYQGSVGCYGYETPHYSLDLISPHSALCTLQDSGSLHCIVLPPCFGTTITSHNTAPVALC